MPAASSMLSGCSLQKNEQFSMLELGHSHKGRVAGSSGSWRRQAATRGVWQRQLAAAGGGSPTSAQVVEQGDVARSLR